MNEAWKSSIAWQTIDKENNKINPARYFTNGIVNILVIYNSQGKVLIADVMR